METRREFKIRCKRCGNKMKYATNAKINELGKKRKRCVYCGFSINIIKSAFEKKTLSDGKY